MSNQDTYQLVTDKIIEALERVEAGEWERPWDPTLGTPSNRHSGNAYSGVNVPLLWIAQQIGDYECSEWLTFKQALNLDGHVRKGESGTKIALFTKWTKDVAVDQHGNEVDVDVEEAADRADLKVESRRLPLWKTYTVFNVEQCEGVEPSHKTDPVPPGERHEGFEQFVARTGADVQTGSPEAAYSPNLDSIRVPDIEAFDKPASFYSTLAHELTHWTGHEKRLDRDFSGRFGDDAYAFEELIAELGGAFTTARFGIERGNFDKPAKYIAHWLEILRGDEYAVILASSKAKQAAQYLEECAEPNEAAAE